MFLENQKKPTQAEGQHARSTFGELTRRCSLLTDSLSLSFLFESPVRLVSIEATEKAAASKMLSVHLRAAGPGWPFPAIGTQV